MAGSSRRGVRELLAVYGGGSAAATDTDRRDFGASVDAFLPGYSTHPGWYDEIERYFFPELPRRTPDVRAALTELADESNNDVRLAQPEKARLLLALAIITRLGRLDPQCALPKLATADSDLAIESLAAVGPGSLDPGQRRDNARAFYNETFAPGVPERFVTKDAFDELRRTALTGGAIGGETAATPVCDAAVVTVGGVPAVVVDSAFTDDTVTLTNLKKIVNPYNWNENYPAFFARMDRCPEMICPDGWRRVLESVDFFDGVRIRTPLKYLPITENPGFAMLEYDLDMSNFDSGDRRVLVDRGYINMFASNPAHDPDQPGVRVQTRKVVHIDGMSPFAQQRLVCITGYGTASSDFLLGPAGAPPADAEPFDFPPDQAAADRTDIDDHPVALHRHGVPAAVQTFNDTLMDLTAAYGDLAQKWWTTGVSASEVAEFGGRVGRRLAAAPLAYLDAMNRPRYHNRGGPRE